MNQCIRLVSYLESFSNFRPVEETKTAMIGFVGVWGNLRSVYFLFLNDYNSKKYFRL